MPTLVLTLYKSHLNDKWCKVWTFSLLSKAIQFYNHIHTHFRGFERWVIPPGNICVYCQTYFGQNLGFDLIKVHIYTLIYIYIYTDLLFKTLPKAQRT